MIEELIVKLKEDGRRAIYACDTSLSSWGIDAYNKDISVWSIFIHPLNHYLSIKDPHFPDISIEKENINYYSVDLKSCLEGLYNHGHYDIYRHITSTHELLSTEESQNLIKILSSDIDYKKLFAWQNGQSYRNYQYYMKTTKLNFIFNCIIDIACNEFIYYFRSDKQPLPPHDFNELINKTIESPVILEEIKYLENIIRHQDKLEVNKLPFNIKNYIDSKIDEQTLKREEFKNNPLLLETLNKILIEIIK